MTDLYFIGAMTFSIIAVCSYSIAFIAQIYKDLKERKDKLHESNLGKNSKMVESRS